MTAAPLQFLLLVFAGWVNRRQLEVIDYLKEENQVLREQLGGRKLRFTDNQRRRLAAKGRVLGRRVLDELAGLVTPDTILRWRVPVGSVSPNSVPDRSWQRFPAEMSRIDDRIFRHGRGQMTTCVQQGG